MKISLKKIENIIKKKLKISLKKIENIIICQSIVSEEYIIMNVSESKVIKSSGKGRTLGDLIRIKNVQKNVLNNVPNNSPNNSPNDGPNRVLNRVLNRVPNRSLNRIPNNDQNNNPNNDQNNNPNNDLNNDTNNTTINVPSVPNYVPSSVANNFPNTPIPIVTPPKDSYKKILSGRKKFSNIPTNVVFTKTKKYNRESLAFAVDDFRNNIIKKGSDEIDGKKINTIEIELIQRFQSKFKESRKVWNAIMEKMLMVAIKLDEEYFNKDYYGFKRNLIHDFLNITISSIVIGTETTHGKGIADFDSNIFPIHRDDKDTNAIFLKADDGSLIRLNKYVMDKSDSLILEHSSGKTNDFGRITDNINSITIPMTLHERIQKYLESLPITMDKIRIEYLKIDELAKKHTYHLQEHENLSAKVKNISYEDEYEVEELKKEEERSKNEIENIVSKTKKCKNHITYLFRELSRYLYFDYFMHDGWCRYIDGDLQDKMLRM